MTKEYPKAVWDRAREIFERAGPKDMEWGEATSSGKQAFIVQEREELTPARKIVSEEVRARYLEVAEAELKDEAKKKSQTP